MAKERKKVSLAMMMKTLSFPRVAAHSFFAVNHLKLQLLETRGAFRNSPENPIGNRTSSFNVYVGERNAHKGNAY